MITPNILLKYDSAYVRIVLRAYFSIVLIIIAFLGNVCCSIRATLQVLREGKAPVMNMTGWLHAFDAFRAMWQLKSNPFGWLGPAMILAGLIDIIADLSVAGLVNSEYVYARCNFNTTGYYIVFGTEAQTAPIVPETRGTPFDLITQAQQISIRNGGLDGIYDKANSNLNFLAAQEDIIGTWNCLDVNNDQTYDFDSNMTNILTDLIKKRLLNGDTAQSVWQNWPDYSTGQLTAFSTGLGDGDVLVSIETSKNNYINKVIKSFKCFMDAPKAEWVLSKIEWTSSTNEWCDLLRTKIYSNSSGDANIPLNPAESIQSVLNSLIMNAGTSWFPNISQINDLTQGCLAPRTKIPLIVTILFSLVAIACLTMVLYSIVLKWQLLNTLAIKSVDREVVENQVPIGLIQWMRYGMAWSIGRPNVRVQDLKNSPFVVRTYEQSRPH
jgi:hypothetical protein